MKPWVAEYFAVAPSLWLCSHQFRFRVFACWESRALRVSARRAEGANMNDNQSQTASLVEIVSGIRKGTVMLPEFQRDFRWELEQTYDLFDSLIRDIFIGTIIYGKPSFEITLREIDQRPRKSKGHRVRVEPLRTYNYTADQIHAKTQTENFCIILDGQQRITSIYRALVGIDSVYVILRPDLDATAVSEVPLERLVEIVAGEESPTAISVKLSDAYQADVLGLDDEDLNKQLGESLYARRVLKDADEAQCKAAERIYRRAIRKLIDLYKQQKLIAYYLLDMSLDKFCVFFERSNSRGIQLNFTDILAAKLYNGFNLRQKIEEYESQNKFDLNREVVVRAIAYICGARNGSEAISIDKSYILGHLQAADFRLHWEEACTLYTESLHYLASQQYILSQDWMPSENLIIPIMMFLRQVGGFNRINEDQRAFLEFWYWASIFSNRYSGASNEAIIGDSAALIQVARGEQIRDRNYFARLRSRVTEAEDLYSYSKKASAIYRGVLNLLAYASRGLRDWNSTQQIDVSMRLEDHHIYPQAFISSDPSLDLDHELARQLVDCVVNRTLISKPTNLTIGKKPPQTYLAELNLRNSHLAECLPGHLIPAEMINDPTWNNMFGVFLAERAQNIYALIQKYAINPGTYMASNYGIQGDSDDKRTVASDLGEMLANGRVRIGERVFTKKQPLRFARIVDGNTVEFEGKKMSINAWGQQMTGWVSINIYASVILERTNQPLGALRISETVA
jgi:hypothetical protein